MSGDGEQLGKDWVVRACSFWTGADFGAARVFWAERHPRNLSLS